MYEKIFSRIHDRLIAVGLEQKKQIEKTFHFNEDRVGYIWNGVEPALKVEQDTAFRNLSLAGKVIIVAVGTLTEQKGYYRLLEIIKILKDRQVDNFAVLITGGGPLEKVIRSRIEELVLGDVVFLLGRIKRAAVSVIPYADIFLQTSLWEAMSIVILEAMAAGKPIVATDVGENRHVLENGKSGFLFHVDDMIGMADSLEHLIISPEVRKKVGCSAQERYNTHFTAQVMTDSYTRLYKEVLGDN